MKTKKAGRTGGRCLQGAVDPFHSAHKGSRTILLVSNDEQFHESLRTFANKNAFMVVKADGRAGTLAILQATRPVAVLLDLDLPGLAAWEAAEVLLNESSCPAVMLATGRTEQYDATMAMRAGTLISKHESPLHLCKTIEKALEESEVNPGEHKAIQRVLLQWLRPSPWVEQISPAYRFWGINE